METFAYKARSSSAATMEGTLQAETRAAALQDLEARGLFPLELTVAEEAGGAREQAVRWLGRVSNREVTSFSRELADLLRAGLNLDAALDILIREAPRPRLAEMIAEIKGAVATGAPLSKVVAEREDLFGPLFANMVAAGEEGGFLDEALDRVAQFREKRDRLVAKIKEAMVYPAILTLLGTATVAYLLAFFIPRFSEVFAEMGAALPGPTRFLLALSGVLSQWWWMILILGGLAFMGLLEAQRSPRGKRFRDMALLRIPLVRIIARNSALARLARTLGTLVGSGVPVLRALEIAGRAAGNVVYTEAIERVTQQVKEGAKLGEAMAADPVFPPSFRGRVAIGEESGRLEEILGAMADTYEEGVDRAVKAFITAFEPAMICVLAGVVGFIVVAMLLPIFTLSKAIRQ